MSLNVLILLLSNLHTNNANIKRKKKYTWYGPLNSGTTKTEVTGITRAEL